jgi:hypothetical protein
MSVIYPGQSKLQNRAVVENFKAEIVPSAAENRCDNGIRRACRPCGSRSSQLPGAGEQRDDVRRALAARQHEALPSRYRWTGD